MFKNYKFGDITKSVTKKVGSDVAHFKDKNNYQFGDITKGVIKTVGSEDYKFGDMAKGVIETVGSDQRWKIDGNMLKNKAEIWKSVDSWVIKTRHGYLIYIENTSTTKVLEAKSDGKVIQEVFVEGKADQLWKKGKPDAEGYFTLQNVGVPKVITAISESGLEIKDRVDHVKDKNDYKFGDITKTVTETVGSDVANAEDKNNYKFGDITKGVTKTVGSEDYKFGDITKGVTKTVGSGDYKFGDITKGLTKQTAGSDVAPVEDKKDFGWLGRAK